MRVILEVIASEQPGQLGQRFVFDQREAFVVGRKKNERVKFRIPRDPYLSRFHFRIEVSPPRCLIHDLDSRNGTQVNGQKIQTAELKDGDVIRGGRTELRVRIELPETREPPVEPAPSVGESPRPTGDRPRLSGGSGFERTTVFGLPRPSGAAVELRCVKCKRLAEQTLLDVVDDPPDRQLPVRGMPRTALCRPAANAQL